MCSQIGRDKELGGLNEVGRELGKAGGSISQALETQVRSVVGSESGRSHEQVLYGNR